MEFLRRVDEELDTLASSTGRRYNTITEAVNVAKMRLSKLRESYVAEVMRRNKGENDSAPSLSQFHDIEICMPYSLACNTTNLPAKIILLSLNGIQMLLDYGMVPSNYASEILKGLHCVATLNKYTSSIPEVQMKVLQLELYLINFLGSSQSTMIDLNFDTVGAFLSLAMQLSLNTSNTSLSVSSTALATVKQMFNVLLGIANDDENQATDVRECIKLLIDDLSLLLRNKSTKWLQDVKLSKDCVLDLIYDLISEWPHLFKTIFEFGESVRRNLFPAIVSTLKSLHEDFIISINTKSRYSNTSNNAAGGTTIRTLKVARYFILNFHEGEFTSEVQVLAALLLHSLRAEPGIESRLDINIDETGKMKNDEPMNIGAGIVNGLAGAGGIAGNLISRLNPMAQNNYNTNSINDKNSNNNNNSGNTSPTNSNTKKFYYFVEVADTNNHSTTEPHFIPCFPAVLCMETILTFFLQCDITGSYFEETKAHSLTLISTSSIEMLSIMLKEALAVEGNILEMANFHSKSNPIIAILMEILAGVDVDEQMIRKFHDLTFSAVTITPGEILAFAYLSLQIIIRFFLTCSLAYHASIRERELSDMQTSHVFISSNQIRDLGLLVKNVNSESILESLKTIFERTSDGILDACRIILSHSDDSGLLRRTLSMVSELAIICGLTGQMRLCDASISTLCKCTVPRWHGHDASPQKGISTQIIKWRHVQAVIRLMQVIHTLADHIVEWEMILDSFEQISATIKSSEGVEQEDVSALDLEKISNCLERFKSYSVYLSDAQLFKTTSSFVAVSLNGLAVGASVQGRPSSPRQSTNETDNHESLNMSYSLQSLLDIVKYNAYRISVIWQLVTSHLKMIASMKGGRTRKMAVNATKEIIIAALEYMIKGDSSELFFLRDSEFQPSNQQILLSDDTIFSRILPGMDGVFSGKQLHQDVLIMQKSSIFAEKRPILTESDVLSCLKALSVVKSPEIKIDVMQGLLDMLQGGGQVVMGGWTAIIDLLATVPKSMVDNNSNIDNIDDDDQQDGDENDTWPKESLFIAFSSMKLLVDDFLLFLDEAMFQEIIVALSLFGTQNVDVNICLTAIEMSWKVVDFIMNSEEIRDDISILIFDSTLNHLLHLARDPRPEIRNCATNTLFSTMVSNVSRLQMIQWQHAFDDVIFKLFEQVKNKFHEAMLNNEKAMTPELKKGVKMTVHYSRDTAQKQWSETTVLALRGLAKIMRTCTRNLVNELWFQSTWKEVLELCVTTIRSPDYVNEVPLAGIDVIFTMLKIVSSHVYIIKARVGKGTRMVGGVLVDEITNNNTAEDDNILTTSSSNSSEHDDGEARGREDLWKLAWSAIGEVSCCPSNTTSLALHIINNLNELYIGGMDTEFKDSENIRRLFEFVLSSSRSRDAKISESKMNRVEAMQMSRAVSDLIHRVEPVTETGFHILISALAEISFSSTPSSANFPGCHDLTTLHPIPSKLRCEAASFLARLHALSTQEDNIVRNEDELSDTKIRIPASVLATYPVVVVGHFVSWQCASLIANRDSLEQMQVGVTDSHQTTPSKLDNTPKKSNTPNTSNSMSSWFLFNNTDDDDQQNVDESMELELMTVREFSLEPFLYFSQKSEYLEEGKGMMEKTNASRAEYTVLPIRKEELTLIFNTMRDVLSNPTTISEGLADKLLIGACCIVSPWKSNEIPQTDDRELQTEEECKAASSLVEYFTHAIVTSKVSESIAYRFIGSIGIISRILVQALQSLQKTDEDTLISYYNDLLGTCGTTLFLFQASKLKSLSSIALQSLINLARDLISACLLVSADVECKLLQYLEEFMPTFLTMESYTNQLPKDDYDFSSHEEVNDDDCKSIILMKAFASSVLHSRIPQSFTANIETGLEIDSNKGHVFLILPLGFKACEASNIRLRTIGRSIIGSANFHSLISSFSDMRAKVNELEEDNKSLRQQIKSLESAAHIGF